jgi:ribonucleoside-diphosphate reductase alpha chain
MTEYLGINIDYSRDRIIPEQGLLMLTTKGFYKTEWEGSPQESFARASTCYCFGDYELAKRIYDAVSSKWFTFASPVLSTAIEIEWPRDLRDFEAYGDWLEDNIDTPSGLPISCFLNSIEDTKESLVDTRTEANLLSMSGGGIGVYFGNRSPDEKSTGVMAHLAGWDADCLSYKQTSSRRGSIAAYLDITHPEIIKFIRTRNPIGGKNFNINTGVNITDKFMKAVINGDDYELIDPKHGPTGIFLSAREVWEDLMDQRFETGEPYLCFIDTINRSRPPQITKALYNVRQSNLCSEITLMTSNKRTAVCCLSSLNLDKYDEWKDTTLVADLVRFLDNVLEYFIRLAPPGLSKAVYSARKERAIGLGTLGFHSYLQRKGVPFESGGLGSASQINFNIYRNIKAQAVESSKVLASERGEPDDCVGSGMRNSHLLAIAPNASSSSLVNVSPSIEPWAANAFSAEGRAGAFLIKNPHLVTALEELNLNTADMWARIVKAEGSIQGIEEIPESVRRVFKTSFEIDQMWIIEHAAIRAPEVCQSQSVNTFLLPGSTAQMASDICIAAWAKGVKSLYYCRSDAPVSASVSRSDTVRSSKPSEPACLSCEG